MTERSSLRILGVSRVGAEAIVSAREGVLNREMRFPASAWEGATPEERFGMVAKEWLRQDAEERGEGP